MNEEVESLDLTGDDQPVPTSYQQPYSVNTKSSFAMPLLPSYHPAGLSGFRIPPGGDDFAREQVTATNFPTPKSLQLHSRAQTADTVHVATDSPGWQPIQYSPLQQLQASRYSQPQKRDSLLDTSSNMADSHHDPYSTPQKKRKLHATQSGDMIASPFVQESPYLSKHRDATTPVTGHAPLTPSHTPAPVGMFSMQARKQRNGVQAPLQPPFEGQDIQAEFMATVRTAETLLANLYDKFVRPMIDLAAKVNDLEGRVAHLQSENERLRQHVDISFEGQASSTRRAVKEVNDKCEELVIRMDDVEGHAGPFVAGGLYGGPANTGRTRQPGPLSGLMSRTASNSSSDSRARSFDAT